MGGGTIATLEELLRALAKERSLRGRLRVLGHSWKLLRELSPRDREQVALRLGSQWAWKRVERAFLRDGELSESERLVGRAFERMGESDPGELRRMARMLRQGDRAGAQDLLMLTLTEALEEEAEQPEASPEVEPPGAEAEPPGAEAAVQVPAPRTGAALEPEAPAEPAGAAELAEQATPEGVAEPEEPLVAEPIDRVEDVLASTLARRVGEPAAPAPPEPVKEAPGAPPPEPPPEPPPPPAPGAGGAERLRVLRALDRTPRPGADLGRGGRAALLDSLGGGWASRRALSRMIRTRSLEGLDEALQLIAGLARPGQQAWCLGDLLAHWELASADRDRVLEAAPTDAARRRLSHRPLASATARRRPARA